MLDVILHLSILTVGKERGNSVIFVSLVILKALVLHLEGQAPKVIKLPASLFLWAIWIADSILQLCLVIDFCSLLEVL